MQERSPARSAARFVTLIARTRAFAKSPPTAAGEIPRIAFCKSANLFLSAAGRFSRRREIPRQEKGKEKKKKKKKTSVPRRCASTADIGRIIIL
jgi:hypothetical protein